MVERAICLGICTGKRQCAVGHLISNHIISGHAPRARSCACMPVPFCEKGQHYLKPRHDTSVLWVCVQLQDYFQVAESSTNIRATSESWTHFR